MKTAKSIVWLVLVFLVATQAFGGIQGFSICTNSFVQQNPDVSGNIVVWEDKRNGNWDIYGYDLSTGAEFPISLGEYDQKWPVVSGDMVLWTDTGSSGCSEDCDIYGYNLSTGSGFSFFPERGGRMQPAIDDNIFIYWDRGKLQGYSLSTQNSFFVAEIPSSGYDISGEIVIWLDPYRAKALYGHNLSTKEDFPICDNGRIPYYPAIEGEIVVWVDDRNGNRDVWGYNLLTGTEFPICTEGHDQQTVNISGDLVTWEDRRHDRLSIYGYNLSTGRESFYIEGANAAIDGDLLVWRNKDNIYGAFIPEPATLITLLIGASFLVVRKRSR